MSKAREYECPRCHEFENVINNGCDGEVDVTERDGDMYEYIAIQRKCCTCGAQWTEYMRLQYDGYCFGASVFDETGAKMTL